MKLPVNRYALRLLTLAATLITTPTFAITLGQVDDFQGGGFSGWDPLNYVAVANVANAGPLGAGDNALQADFSNRFVFFNQGTHWNGNYTAAGVVKISFDVQHQNEFPLTLRLGIASGSVGQAGSGDTYVTDDSIAVPNDGQWRRVTFDVTPADFVPSLGNTNGTPNSAVALTDVTHLRILHNPVPGDFVGESIEGSIRVDNITAEGVTVDNADFDGDDDVDGSDFLIWQRGVSVGTTQSAGDADSNGTVNGLDLAVWKSQFGPAATPAATAIPEPTSAAIAALAVVAGSSLQRRRRRI